MKKAGEILPFFVLISDFCGQDQFLKELQGIEACLENAKGETGLPASPLRC